MLVGFRLIRPGIHSLPGVGLTSTSSKYSIRSHFDWREAVILPFLSRSDNICGNGNGGLDNKSLVELRDHGIRNGSKNLGAGTMIVIRRYALQLPVASQWEVWRARRETTSESDTVPFL